MQQETSRIFSLVTENGADFLGINSLFDNNIWANLEEHYLTVGHVDFGWNHFCLEVDTLSGSVNISWNGGTPTYLLKTFEVEVDSFFITIGMH